jgi:hypothetical protein
MYKLNHVGDSGHPCLTPWFVAIFDHLFLLFQLLFEFHGITLYCSYQVLWEAPFNHNAPKFIVIHSVEGLFIVKKPKED